MKRYSLWFKLALLFCAVMTVFSATHTSLAYITARSNTVHNSFRVEYLPPQDISVPVIIEKSMVNLGEAQIGPGGFEFYLVNVDTDEAVVAKTSKEGRATIQLKFTADDAGKFYRYRLYEVNDGRKDVTYDDTVYDIRVRLALNELHELSAHLRVDGEPVSEIVAEYENQYFAAKPLPDTGDHSHPLLWTVMLLLSGAGIVMQKKNKLNFGRPQ